MAHDAEGRQPQALNPQTAPARRKSELSLLDAPEVLERKAIHSDVRSNLSRDERVSVNGRPNSALSDVPSSHATATITSPGVKTPPRDLHGVRTIPGMGDATP